MKRIFLLLLIALVVGAWAGQMMMTDSGYVLMAYNQTTVETTLWVFLVGVALAFIIFHVVFNLLFNLNLPTGKWRIWRSASRKRNARKKTLQGLLALSEGQWQKAQTALTRSAEDADIPLVNYIAAAKAAHENGDSGSADEMLRKALEASPDASLAISITQAQIQVSRGQLEAALANLLKLRRKQPKNKQILALLADVCSQLHDWQGVADILPALRQHEALPAKQLENLERTTLLALLKKQRTPAAGKTPEPDHQVRHLQSVWVTMPKTAANYDEVVAEYVSQLIDAKGDKPAEELLKQRLEQKWSEQLIPLYGLLQTPKPRKLYQQAQQWLSKHEQSAGLQLALARLACQCELWTEAVAFYEASLAINPDLEVCAELARLLHQLDQPEKAALVMNRAFNEVSSHLPNLPSPKPALVATPAE